MPTNALVRETQCKKLGQESIDVKPRYQDQQDREMSCSAGAHVVSCLRSNHHCNIVLEIWDGVPKEEGQK